jgi:ABC-type lipoprotein release transport system permease subunit
VGIGFTLIVGRVIASLLYRTSPNDVRVLATVEMTLLMVAVAATLLPARRATRVDPASVLRTD